MRMPERARQKRSRPAEDFERAGDHPDIWTAGRRADDAAGDEGIDDPPLPLVDRDREPGESLARRLEEKKE